MWQLLFGQPYLELNFDRNEESQAGLKNLLTPSSNWTKLTVHPEEKTKRFQVQRQSSNLNEGGSQALFPGRLEVNRNKY